MPLPDRTHGMTTSCSGQVTLVDEPQHLEGISDLAFGQAALLRQHTAR